MIFTSEFLHMANKMGLAGVDLNLAEIAWQKAERAMLGLPVQESVLLKANKSISKIKDPGALTKKELQFLTDLNTSILNLAHSHLAELNTSIQSSWLLCDPEDSTSATTFKGLNHLRSHQRKIKTSMRCLEQIQRKLKKLR
jgi:hypothetical protein